MVNNPNKQTDDVDSSFSCIINLFKSVGISEKGIEKVYHFLLQHQDFVDPKLIQTELDFTLKRIYKIINELKKYDLIQVYGRPMEIKINNPRKSWEKILNNKIDEINEKSEQKILECEKSLNTFFSNFKSDSTPMELMPVEYISLISKDFSTSQIMEEIVGQNAFYFAKGSKFRYEEINSFKKSEEALKNLDFENLLKYFTWDKIYENIDFKIIISKNVLEEIFSEYHNVFEKLDSHKEFFNVKNIQTLSIKICENDFSNFAIRDGKELVQFSTTPSNSVIGLYKSRENEVNNIFNDKFFDLFDSGSEVDKYFKDEFKRKITPFDKIIIGML